MHKKIDLSKINTYPLRDRKSKVKISDLAKPYRKGSSLADYLSTLPTILASNDFKAIVTSVCKAYYKRKPVITALGAHVIKCGLTPIIIDLMKRGIITALSLNGAGIIHDFELAYAGSTSEDVDQEIKSGKFGMAKETGKYINEAINQGAKNNIGMGQAVGQKIEELKSPYKKYSLLYNAYMLNIPLTVHVAIGTDVIHMHPQVNGAAIGKSSYLDFQLFASKIRELNNGGVYFNIGSAVLLPEVFLKAITLLRNLGYHLKKFTTVNIDFIKHYRTSQNVVNRPTNTGGSGYHLVGHHEIILPLLAAAIIEEME